MTRVAILWHMHQPYYEDLATGEHILPWVRLHATKDYWGMVALLREFPRVRVSFNLVPSLLVQLEAFAEDRASDRHLQVGLKPADLLDQAEREFLVTNGFYGTFDRMIRPHPRFAELHGRRASPATFTVDELRDLQVLHKLAWMDPDWASSDPRLTRLVDKQRDYSESDKQLLRDVELELLKAVIPAYREAAGTGQIELSTSPFYHPILPLLCDTDGHLRAHPHSSIPRQLYHRPADARDQVRRALAYHERLFGVAPRGVWPSEGSVSDEVVSILASEGCQWTATDEEILSRSLGRGLSRDELYSPYTLGASGLRCLFRDRQLSDLIGFTYQSWDAHQAVDDFLAKVRSAGGEEATVTVILDGENAWEHYPGGGRPFLRALYGKLQEATDIQTVTMTQGATGAARPLPSLFPGSWINGDFYIWAGHADDQRAWRQVAKARAAYDEFAAAVAPEQRAKAWQELLIAQGSDWFWWYGDDHSSEHDHQFDDLFRRHVANVYRALGRPVPDALHVSNISTGAASTGPLAMRALVTPTVDGRADFIEWAGSVNVRLNGAGGTMHRVIDPLISELRIACDLECVFLRLTGPALIPRLMAGELNVSLLTHRPWPRRIDLQRDATKGPRWSAAHVVEIALPFATVTVDGSEVLSLSILVTDAAGQVLETQPAQRPLEFIIPRRELTAVNWMV